jgi:hypothetical protein
MKVHASAMSHIPSDTTDECYIDTVLGAIIQPLLQGCRLAGQSLGQADMAVFMLNNVSAIKVCNLFSSYISITYLYCL